MTKPIIFLGPSLPLPEAQRILDADYRAPAKKGDFLRLMNLTEKCIIGFIDGVFLHDYPPSPIEVYSLATNRHATLIGAASLGALRAVELERFGMIGVGKVFDLYKTKILDADDEVAVTFVQGQNILQSEAMIDIRFNLFLAYRSNIIDYLCMRTLTTVAKSLYFPYRRYHDIVDIAEKTRPNMTEQLERFREYVSKKRDSLKARDSIYLLKYIKKLIE